MMQIPGDPSPPGPDATPAIPPPAPPPEPVLSGVAAIPLAGDVPAPPVPELVGEPPPILGSPPPRPEVQVGFSVPPPPPPPYLPPRGFKAGTPIKGPAKAG